jgi:hypothetical protein
MYKFIHICVKCAGVKKFCMAPVVPIVMFGNLIDDFIFEIPSEAD